MTLRHFLIFLNVCDEEGMTKAAEKLHISQPSVSQAIKELEEHYQVKLFERLGKRLFITPAGQELMHYARHVLSLTNKAESTLRGFSVTPRSALVPPCQLAKVFSFPCCAILKQNCRSR